MKKFYAALVALFMVIMASVAFASPASADDDDNKQVTFCHYDGSNENGGSGKYSKITTSVNAFFNAGHIDHVNDIWNEFSYTTKGGDVVTVPAQGDTSLLAFDNCEQPDVDDEIAVPAVNKVDKCGTEDDTVTPVRDDTKYTTVVGPRVGDSVTVVFTALDGFTFPDGDKVVEVTVTFPNNDDCDLPETGGAVTNTLGGIAVLALLAIGGVFLLRRRTI